MKKIAAIIAAVASVALFATPASANVEAVSGSRSAPVSFKFNNTHPSDAQAKSDLALFRVANPGRKVVGVAYPANGATPLFKDNIKTFSFENPGGGNSQCWPGIAGVSAYFQDYAALVIGWYWCYGRPPWQPIWARSTGPAYGWIYGCSGNNTYINPGPYTLWMWVKYEGQGYC